MSPARTPRPPRVPRPQRDLRVRSDESIGRPEDIGSLVAKPANNATSGTKPVRVTLNIPPQLYRQLRKWTDAAADELGVPQVSQQDALRAMISAAILDKSVGQIVIGVLRLEPPLITDQPRR